MKNRHQRCFFGGPPSFFGRIFAPYAPVPVPTVVKLRGLINRMFFNRQG